MLRISNGFCIALAKLYMHAHAHGESTSARITSDCSVACVLYYLVLLKLDLNLVPPLVGRYVVSVLYGYMYE